MPLCGSLWGIVGVPPPSVFTWEGFPTGVLYRHRAAAQSVMSGVSAEQFFDGLAAMIPCRFWNFVTFEVPQLLGLSRTGAFKPSMFEEVCGRNRHDQPGEVRAVCNPEPTPAPAKFMPHLLIEGSSTGSSHHLLRFRTPDR